MHTLGSARFEQARGAGSRSRAVIATGLLLLGALLSHPLRADDTDGPLQQRTRFLEAKMALEQGDAMVFMRTASELKDYPLYPYLIYWHLRDKLSEQSPVTIRAFLDSQSDTPLAPLLRGAWLRFLAREERWKDYLDFYQDSRSTEQRCYFHTAQLNTGHQPEAWAGAEKLWLVGHSQPEACDNLFADWEQAGRLTPALRWRRIELSMASGYTGLAGYLAKGLEEEDRRWVTLWRKVYDKPQRIADSELLQTDSERSRTIVLQGLQRLASQQPETAAELWPELALRYSFTESERNATARAIALDLAMGADVRALEWFAALPAESLNESSRGWAVRTALRHQRWKAAVAWIESMPAGERNAESWSYWLGRAYEAMGEKSKAEGLYRTVSGSRGYYGFLAADRLGTDYNLSHEVLSVDPQALDRLERNPALVRAKELYHLTLITEARREWDYAVSRMSREERLTAGKLADKWQWYDRALLTLARANYFDDLTIRFPLAYNEAVSREAEKRSLDPAWIYAVARQESAMSPDVTSPAGALGLMQLMPGTGRAIAKKLDADISHQDELLEPDTNIRFGSYYLSQVLAQFGENPVLATAAYNAGPNRIMEWFPEQKSLDADIWVDTMPYHETRQYVRRVMAYAVFYDQRLERPIKRLSERMPSISKPKQVISRCEGCSAEKDHKS